MKRFLAILVAALMLAGILPAAALAKTENAPVKDETVVASWDFETDPAADGWLFIDADGDGHNFAWVTDNTHNGSGHCIKSCSYEGGALSPDNWAISPAVTLPAGANAQLDFFYKNYSTTYPERFRVYAGTEPYIDSLEPLTDIIQTSSSEYEEVRIDVSAYAGSTFYFAIRHYDVTDMFKIYFDDFSVTSEAGGEPGLPEVIYEADAVGFAAPQPGDMVYDLVSAITAPDGAPYIAYNVTWENRDTYEEMDVFDTFEEGGHYAMTFWFDADEGYSFADDCAFTLNGSSELIDLDNSYVHAEDNTLATVCTLTLTCGAEDPNQNMISAIEISGLDIPAWGAAADFELEVPEDASYSVDTASVSWGYHDTANNTFGILNPGDVFDNENAAYTLYFEIAADENYIFAEEVTVTINGEAALVDFNGHQGMTRYYVNTVEFTVTEPQTVDLDEALNIEGGELHFENDETYPWEVVIERTSDGCYARSTNAGVSNSEAGVTTTVFVTAGDILTFDFLSRGEGSDNYDWDGLRVYVDGVKVLSYGAHTDWESAEYIFTEGGEHTIRFTFKKDGSVNGTGDFAAIDNVAIAAGLIPPAVLIDTIEINDFVEPAWGEAPFFALTVPEDAHYSISSAVWYWYDDSDSGAMTEDELFNDANKTYYMALTVIADEGYEFAASDFGYVAALINGSDEYINYAWIEGADTAYIYTIDFTVEEPAGAIIGDVDMNGAVEITDAILGMRYTLGLVELTDEQLAQLDVNGDGVYDLIDCILIMRYAMGLITGFPVPQEPEE